MRTYSFPDPEYIDYNQVYNLLKRIIGSNRASTTWVENKLVKELGNKQHITKKYTEGVYVYQLDSNESLKNLTELVSILRSIKMIEVESVFHKSMKGYYKFGSIREYYKLGQAE